MVIITLIDGRIVMPVPCSHASCPFMPWLAASERLATVNATPRVTAATAMPPRYAHWVTRVRSGGRRISVDGGRAAVAAEPERVRDDADRAHRHRGRREDRVEQDAVPPVQGAGGDRDERQVVDERPAEALLDGGDGAPGQGDGGHDAAQVAADQGDVGGGDRDVGAGAQGDAEVGLGERRAVVDAVTGHRDDVALVLQRDDVVGLLRRQHLGEHVLDADLAGDGGRGGGVVAGQHPHLQPEGLQLGDRLGGLRLQRVGDQEQPGR